jgi:hypothetical protein
MALITKPPAWAYCTTSMSGTPNTTISGGQVTAGANNTPGSNISLLTLTHDAELILVGVAGYQGSNANSSTLVDILYDPAGGTSWSVLIPELLAGFTLGLSGTAGIAQWYAFPVWVKSGAAIGARAQTAHTATINTGRVVVYAFGGNANPSSWWCGSRVTAVGTSAASSQGTNHTAGNSGAYSTWADFGSTLPSHTGALQFAVHGTNTTTTANALAYYYEFGVGGSRIGPNIYRNISAAETGWQTTTGPIFCNLASGTQMQVRGTCSGTAQTLDVAAYAVS